MQSSKMVGSLSLCSSAESIRARSAMKTYPGNHVEREGQKVRTRGPRRKKTEGKEKEKDFPSELDIGRGRLKRDSKSIETALLVRVVS
jgi:hypothetical protein